MRTGQKTIIRKSSRDINIRYSYNIPQRPVNVITQPTINFYKVPFISDYYRIPFPAGSVETIPADAIPNAVRGSVYYEDTAINSRYTLRRMYEDAYFNRNKGFWVFGASLMPGFGYRTLRVNAAQYPDQSGLLQRQDTEHPNEFWCYNVFIGHSMSRNSSLMADFLRINQGYRSTGRNIDPRSGLPQIPGAADYVYNTDRIGGGILYSFSGYGDYSGINGALDLGIYSIWTMEDGHIANRHDDGLRPQSFVLRGGIGLNIHPVYQWEIRVVPTMYYDLNSINTGSVLRANLFNYGLSVGVLLHTRKGFKYQ